MVAVEEVKNNFSLITPLPDDDTMEIVLYGTAYPDVKAALFRLDMMEDKCANDMQGILDKIREDSDGFKEVFAKFKDKPFEDIRTNQPGYNMRILLRDYLEITAAGRWCAAHRELVKMYGRVIGAMEQGVHIRASKEQIETYRNSIIQVAREPMDFGTIREAYNVR